MVIDKFNAIAATQIADLLTGPLSSNAEYVENLQRALHDRAPDTVRAWISAARVFSKWYEQTDRMPLEGCFEENLRKVLSLYFGSRKELKPNSNLGHFSSLKSLFNCHPDIYMAVSDRQWSSIRQRVLEISCQPGRSRRVSVVQPIVKKHVFALADNVKGTLAVSRDRRKREHLLGLRALAAVAHSGMFRGWELKELRVENIDEIVTNLVSRRQVMLEDRAAAHADRRMQAMGISTSADVFDPPIGSVTCRVCVADTEGTVFSRMGPEMTSWVLEWLDFRRPLSDDDLLFFTRESSGCKKALTPTATCRLFCEILELSGIEVRNVNVNSFLYGAIVDYLLKGACYCELWMWTRKNGRGVSTQRVRAIDEQLRAHRGTLDDFIIDL